MGSHVSADPLPCIWVTMHVRFFRRLRCSIRMYVAFLPRSACDSKVFTGMSTYLLIWPSDGVMKMEDVRGVYDGSYFCKAAAANKLKKK